MKKTCVYVIKLHFRVKDEYYKARRKSKYTYCLVEYFIRIKQHLDKGTLKCRCSGTVQFINWIKWLYQHVTTYGILFQCCEISY